MTIDLDALEAVLAKATPGEWQQGRLLATPETRRFSFEQRADFSDVEKSTIYIGFLVEDEGRSRKCIGSTLGGGNRHSDAAAIVALHNAAPALIAEHRAALARVAELEGARALLAEITPPKLIGESHVPYPEGKTTVLMSWDWLKRARAALEPKL